MTEPAPTAAVWKFSSLFAASGLMACLALAIYLRWPMVASAARHMDSDLAVDGLTLRQFVEEGKWRWHYPGTPHIGMAPMLLSLPAVAAWGEGPAALVFAGLASNMLLISGVYLLVLRAYGRVPAFFSGLVLAAGGLGQVWLSARVTGGHLLAAAWLAWAWFIWSHLIHRNTITLWIAFGLYCGLGLWVDSIFLLGLAGLFVASMVESWKFRKTVSLKIRLAQAILFTVMLPIGPFLTSLGDGENVYGNQFELISEMPLFLEHTKILFLQCLPRLIFGRSLPGKDEITWPDQPFKNEMNQILIAGLIALCLSAITLKFVSKKPSSENRQSWLSSLWLGLFVVCILNFVAFILNKNIFNSDNYRYLVPILPAIGLFYAWLASSGRLQYFSASIILLMALLLCNDVYSWQIDAFIRESTTAENQIKAIRDEQNFPGKIFTYRRIFVSPGNGIPPIVNGTFEADYWVVYKSIYLYNLPISAGRPFGFYPDRFQNVSPKNPRYVVISDNEISRRMLAAVQNEEFDSRYQLPQVIVLRRKITNNPLQ
ncbi:MAG: hypothetical protein ACKO0V_06765 [bacterium]